MSESKTLAELEEEYFSDLAVPMASISQYILIVVLVFVIVVGADIIPMMLLIMRIFVWVYYALSFGVSLGAVIIIAVFLQNKAMKAMNRVQELHDVIVVTDTSVYRFPLELKKEIPLLAPEKLFSHMAVTTRAFQNFLANKAIAPAELVEQPPVEPIGINTGIETGIRKLLSSIQNELSKPSFADVMDKRWKRWESEQKS